MRAIHFGLCAYSLKSKYLKIFKATTTGATMKIKITELMKAMWRNNK